MILLLSTAFVHFWIAHWRVYSQPLCINLLQETGKLIPSFLINFDAIICCWTHLALLWPCLPGHSSPSFIWLCCVWTYIIFWYLKPYCLLFHLSHYCCIVDGRKLDTNFHISFWEFSHSQLSAIFELSLSKTISYHIISNGTDSISITVVLTLPLLFSFWILFPLLSSFFCKCFFWLLCIYPSCCSSFYS